MKILEDSHVYPLLENELFKALLALTNNPPDKYTRVNELSLMLLDPELLTLIATAFKGVKIRGETYLEHEFAHAMKAHELGVKDSFIALSFFWIKKGRYRELGLLRAGGVLPVEASGDIKKKILMAPRYPSEGDYGLLINEESANSYLKHLAMGVSLGLKQSKGEVLTTELMARTLRETWRKYRLHKDGRV